MDNNNNYADVVATYIENIASAEPLLPEEAVDLTAAAVFANYLAAAVDPGAYSYFPHPYTDAEEILHHAAAHLLATADEYASARS